VTWPDASLDPIRRLRVVAAALPNAGVGEIVLDHPYDDVWAWLMDHEHAVPRFDREVRRIRVRGHDEQGRVLLTAWQRHNPLPMPFVVTIEDGWCLMQARGRLFTVLQAAVPVDGGARTRYAHAEAVPLPGTAFLRSRLQRMVDADLRGLARTVLT